MERNPLQLVPPKTVVVCATCTKVDDVGTYKEVVIHRLSKQTKDSGPWANNGLATAVCKHKSCQNGFSMCNIVGYLTASS